MQIQFDDLWIPEPNTGCHIWIGSLRGSNPRPMYKQKYAGRFACERENGPPPTAKHQAAHATRYGCLGGLCVNGKHLRWATNKENAGDVPVTQRSEIMRKWYASAPPEKRKEMSRKAHAAMTPEQRSEKSKRAYTTALAKGFNLNAKSSERMKLIWAQRRAERHKHPA